MTARSRRHRHRNWPTSQHWPSVWKRCGNILIPTRGSRSGSCVHEIVVDLDSAASGVVLVIHWFGGVHQSSDATSPPRTEQLSHGTGDRRFGPCARANLL